MHRIRGGGGLKLVHLWSFQQRVSTRRSRWVSFDTLGKPEKRPQNGGEISVVVPCARELKPEVKLRSTQGRIYEKIVVQEVLVLGQTVWQNCKNLL